MYTPSTFYMKSAVLHLRSKKIYDSNISKWGEQGMGEEGGHMGGGSI